MSRPFTVRMVDSVKPDPARRVEVPDGALPCLYLVVNPSGAKGWAVRYRFDGRPRKLTLGPYPRIGLADARTMARDALARVAEGTDPGTEKKTAREAAKRPQQGPRLDTFGNVTEDYFARVASKRNKAWQETKRLVTKDCAAWWDRPIRDITRRDVRDLNRAGFAGGSRS